MAEIDLMALAGRQVARDRQHCAEVPALLQVKQGRMLASALAFLRGTAPLFYEILAARPALGQGPPGTGWLCGDLHIENFGAYRPDALSTDDSGPGHPVAFHVNDFDEATIGPLRWDVLRLCTSLILGGRELRADGPRVLRLCAALLDRYGAALAGAPLPAPPAPVAALIERARGRSRKDLLAARTEQHKGAWRLARGARYLDLPAGLVQQVPAALSRYAAGLDPGERPSDGQLAVIDAAWRVAGTGSLGGLRVAALTHGKGGDHGGWIFDLKESADEGAPALLGAAGAGGARGAQRVVTAIRACLPQPPGMLGTTQMAGRSLLLRRLSPQEDKLELQRLQDSDLDALASYLGALCGQLHRRGATGALPTWGAAERDAIMDQSIAVAGLHETLYLLTCRLSA